MTVSDFTTDNYSYDAIDQVTGVAYGSGRNVGYAYDPVGNRTSLADSTSGRTSYTTNSLNQYTASIHGHRFAGSYTAIASQVPVYDGNGNLTSYNGLTCAYDAQNRPISATSVVQFSYDPQNRCVSRTLNETTTYLRVL